MNPHLAPAALALLRHYPLPRGRWRLLSALDAHYEAIPVTRRARVAGGTRMLLDTSDFLQRSLFLAGDFEPEVSACIQANLRPGDCFADLGANVGFYTLMAARRVGPEGRVFAFEPNPGTYAALCANVALNQFRQVTPVQLALSDACGTAALYADAAGNSGASSLLPREASGAPTTVRTMTWDEYAAQHAVPTPSLVKMDVEGFELHALRGMKGLLTAPNAPRFLIKVSEGSLRDAGGSRAELETLMAEHGYVAQVISAVRQSNQPHHGGCVQYDALFVPRS